MQNDIAHCVFDVIPEPERQRLAHMIPSCKVFFHHEMLPTTENLQLLCIRNYDVYYRPGEEPSDSGRLIRDSQDLLEKRVEPQQTPKIWP